jgi:hypothetical protein
MMWFALTFAILAAQPALPVGGADVPGSLQLQLPEERPSLRKVDLSTLPPPPALTLALASTRHEGSGDGEDHSGHMGAMWIVMGAAMVVMMVGVGVYAMRGNSSFMERPATGLSSPAQLALPVTGVRGGGG